MINEGCIHNVSDEDCNKCMIYGIIFRCPINCEHYKDCYVVCGESENNYEH